jgi:hypothetical protein
MNVRIHLLGVFCVAILAGGRPLAAAAEKSAPKPAAKAPAKPAVPKAEEPAPPIEGVVIARGSGFLALRISDNHFVLAFYDAKRKKVPADVARAALRWPVRYQPADERTVLTPAADGTLSSQKSVRPPRTFKVFLSLFAEGAEQAAETYAVDFHE